MPNREAGQAAYQQQLSPTYPGPVTSTTECTSPLSVSFFIISSSMLIIHLAPSQSLLAKQRNLAPTLTSTQDQDKMPLESPDKEVLVVNKMRPYI